MYDRVAIEMLDELAKRTVFSKSVLINWMRRNLSTILPVYRHDGCASSKEKWRS